jgi:DNA-binding MarR family transcriptional regulator
MANGTRRHRIGNYDALIMQMLRAGDCSLQQIRSRYGYRSKALDRLVDKGWITRRTVADEWIYALTDAGHQACPPRNPVATTRVIATSQQGIGINGPTQVRQGSKHKSLEY